MSSSLPKSDQRALRRGRAVGVLHEDAVGVVIAEATLDQILDYSASSTDREIGGFLVGRRIEAEREYVVVEQFLPARQTRAQAAARLAFTHETWAEVTREVAGQYPELSVVGWHHTHPDFGVYLSGYDQFIHRSFFAQPWQVALVVDPVRREFAFFHWRADHVVDCGFICLPGEELQAGDRDG